MLSIYAIYFKALFNRSYPIFFFFTASALLIWIVGGGILSVVERDLEVLIRLAPLALLIMSLPLLVILAFTLYTLPGHIRFYKMVRYQEDYRGELASAWKHAVPCVASNGVNALVFTADDWLISVGEIAVKRKNYISQRIVETKVYSKRLKGTIHHIDIYFDNMPWEKASIKSVHAHNAEVAKSIGKWQRNQIAAKEKFV